MNQPDFTEGVDYLIDYYAFADLPRDTDVGELNRAINARLMQYHPDRLHGLAEEFQQKGERITRLLNRAKTMLADPDVRAQYNKLLDTWEGPISTDGVPIISMKRLAARQLQSMGTDEARGLLQSTTEQVAKLSPYNDATIALLKGMLESTADESQRASIRDALNDELRRKATALSVEQVSIAEGVLGLKDQTYAIGGGYAQSFTYELSVARFDVEHSAKVAASLGKGVVASLLAGEVPTSATHIEPSAAVAETVLAKYDIFAAHAQHLAEAREELMHERLQYIVPKYPEGLQQPQDFTNIFVGIHMKDAVGMWLAFAYDAKNFHFDSQDELGEVAGKALMAGRYDQVVADHNANIVLIDYEENIDLGELIGSVLEKHIDSLQK